jgi:predicted transcriptional regulator
MLAPCEVAIKTVTPSIRALIAQTLLDKHKLKEAQVAQAMGITQSAVNKYSKKVRGTTITLANMPEIQTIINEMAILLLDKSAKQTPIMRLFCQACTIIRAKGLMCPSATNHKMV